MVNDSIFIIKTALIHEYFSLTLLKISPEYTNSPFPEMLAPCPVPYVPLTCFEPIKTSILFLNFKFSSVFLNPPAGIKIISSSIRPKFLTYYPHVATKCTPPSPHVPNTTVSVLSNTSFLNFICQGLFFGNGLFTVVPKGGIEPP